MSLKTFKKVGLIAIGTGVALATIATVMIDRKSVKYDDLSSKQRTKFRSAGRRNAWRDHSEAETFFESSVPIGARMMGPEGVDEFLDQKEVSHKKSVENFPHLENDDSNVIWEDVSSNRQRGTRDMNRVEKMHIVIGNHIKPIRTAMKKQ